MVTSIELEGYQGKMTATEGRNVSATRLTQGSQERPSINQGGRQACTSLLPALVGGEPWCRTDPD